MTSLAIIRLTAEDPEDETWVGAVWTPLDGGYGSGQVVALAPKPGHVWVCDGATFHEVAVEQLARGWTEETLL